jgi:Leucine-rich repeat (LRR) protein
MTPAEQRVARLIDAAVESHAQSLDLSGLGLKSLPALPPALQNIIKLKLSRNRLKTLPPALFALAHLEVLDLGANWLAELPPRISHMQSLASLDLSENQLTAVPAELFSSIELRHLSLYGNRLTALPAIAAPLTNLSHLNISSNRLTALQIDAQVYPSLENLDAAGNALHVLDTNFASLSSLRVLNLSANDLTRVQQLAGMPWLVELYLDGNKLSALPPEIANFPALRVLSAEGNPFGQLPSEFDRVTSSVLKKEALRAFQARISGGSEGKEYLNAPSFFFDFALAISGLPAVLRFVENYFQSAFRGGTSAVMKFPDGSILELKNLSRKATLDLVREHERSVSAGKTMIQLDPVRQSPDAALQLLTSTVARIPAAEVVPIAVGQASITLINGNFVQNIHQEVNEMGDRININNNSGVINVKSKLENVTQTINASSADEATKAQLTALMKQLADALAKVPPAQQQDAEAISDAAQDVVAKATKPSPNKKSIEISGKGLLEAAKGIADVVPIAIGIVKVISAFAGIPL